MRHRPSKRRAVENALGQLGWQSRGKDVITHLAEYGIEVSESLVSSVTFGSLRKSDELRMRQARIDQMGRQRWTKGIIELPQRRTYWRGGG